MGQDIASLVSTVGVKGGDQSTIATTANPLPVSVAGMTIENVDVSFPDSIVSTANSTQTPLAGGASFTGGWEEIMKYAGITVIVLADQASATNGAVAQFSDDGVTVLRSVTASIPANVGLAFTIGPEARYMRLTYLNGGTPQTLFRAQTIFHYQPPVPPQLPLGSTTTDISLAQMALSHMKGRSATGAWLPILVDGSGIQRVNTGLVQPTTPVDTQPVSGSVSVSSIQGTVTVDDGHPDPQTNALTDTQLRASAVPVSGPLTDTQLRATAVAISAASLPLPAGAATEATLAKMLPTAYKSIAFETTSAQTDVALIGSSTNILWVKVVAWDGANATLSGTGSSAAVAGSYLRVGTTSSPRIPLWTLTKPDSDVVFEGYITGDIYFTAPASAGKNLVVLVGTA